MDGCTEGSTMTLEFSDAESAGYPRILVAGVGNIFLGDDAFGVEVAQRLMARPQPEGVRVVDFGIRGLDLAYTLLDGYEAVVLVDAAPRGGTPGTLYVLEPDMEPLTSLEEEVPMVETHSLHPTRVLRLVAAMGGRVPHLVVVGCEPGPSAEDDFTAGMSAPVKAAVDEAVPLVESLVARLLNDRRETGAAASEKNTVPEKEAHPCLP
jgi:hydrogenase maturation protease